MARKPAKLPIEAILITVCRQRKRYQHVLGKLERISGGRLTFQTWRVLESASEAAHAITRAITDDSMLVVVEDILLDSITYVEALETGCFWFKLKFRLFNKQLSWANQALVGRWIALLLYIASYPVYLGMRLIFGPNIANIGHSAFGNDSFGRLPDREEHPWISRRDKAAEKFDRSFQSLFPDALPYSSVPAHLFYASLALAFYGAILFSLYYFEIPPFDLLPHLEHPQGLVYAAEVFGVVLAFATFFLAAYIERSGKQLREDLVRASLISEESTDRLVDCYKKELMYYLELLDENIGSGGPTHRDLVLKLSVPTFGLLPLGVGTFDQFARLLHRVGDRIHEPQKKAGRIFLFSSDGHFLHWFNAAVWSAHSSHLYFDLQLEPQVGVPLRSLVDRTASMFYTLTRFRVCVTPPDDIRIFRFKCDSQRNIDKWYLCFTEPIGFKRGLRSEGPGRKDVFFGAFSTPATLGKMLTEFCDKSSAQCIHDPIIVENTGSLSAYLLDCQLGRTASRPLSFLDFRATMSEIYRLLTSRAVGADLVSDYRKDIALSTLTYIISEFVLLDSYESRAVEPQSGPEHQARINEETVTFFQWFKINVGLFLSSLLLGSEMIECLNKSARDSRYVLPEEVIRSVQLSQIDRAGTIEKLLPIWSSKDRRQWWEGEIEQSLRLAVQLIKTPASRVEGLSSIMGFLEESMDREFSSITESYASYARRYSSPGSNGVDPETLREWCLHRKQRVLYELGRLLEELACIKSRIDYWCESLSYSLISSGFYESTGCLAELESFRMKDVRMNNGTRGKKPRLLATERALKCLEQYGIEDCKDILSLYEVAIISPGEGTFLPTTTLPLAAIKDQEYFALAETLTIALNDSGEVVLPRAVLHPLVYANLYSCQCVLYERTELCGLTADNVQRILLTRGLVFGILVVSCNGVESK